MKIDYFRGELTDNSAKKEALVYSAHTCTCPDGDSFVLRFLAGLPYKSVGMVPVLKTLVNESNCVEAIIHHHE